MDSSLTYQSHKQRGVVMRPMVEAPKAVPIPTRRYCSDVLNKLLNQKFKGHKKTTPQKTIQIRTNMTYLSEEPGRYVKSGMMVMLRTMEAVIITAVAEKWMSHRPRKGIITISKTSKIVLSTIIVSKVIDVMRGIKLFINTKGME